MRYAGIMEHDTKTLLACNRVNAAETLARKDGITVLQALRKIQTRAAAEAFNRARPSLTKVYL